MRLCSLCACLFVIAGLSSTIGAAEPDREPRAARSVHLGWQAPEADWFYLEMTVRESVPGSYFMACGWNTGYFGIQELHDRRKVVIFSVWDPTRGDNPNQVAVEDRVELVAQRPDARIRRFGGEGTGGQCMASCEWSIGKPMPFLLGAHIEGDKTAYAGYLWNEKTSQWEQLVSFRVRTEGQPLRGLYSFVEDFRRDYRSAKEVRIADFGKGWVRSVTGDWVQLDKARFTASGATWEARETINALVTENSFRLVTGGATQQTTELRSSLSLPAISGAQPPGGLAEFIRQEDTRLGAATE